MNIIKSTLAAAAVLICCMGNEYPAKAQSLRSQCPSRNPEYCIRWMEAVYRLESARIQSQGAMQLERVQQVGGVQRQRVESAYEATTDILSCAIAGC